MKTFAPVIALVAFLTPMIAAECEDGKLYCYQSLGPIGRENAMKEIAKRNEEHYWTRSGLIREFTNTDDWIFKCHKMGTWEIVDPVKRCTNGLCIPGGGSDAVGRTFDKCIPAHINVDRESIRATTEAAVVERFVRWNVDPRSPDFDHWNHMTFGKKRR